MIPDQLNDVFEKLYELPINDILQDIVDYAMSGGVTIVTAKTASGKTLLVPTMLHLLVREPVVVFEPRRFLAINAAETLAKLSNTDVGHLVRYCVSERNFKERVRAVNSFKGLTYGTYGYGLKARHVGNEDHVVLDEAHEPAMDIAVCKALLKKRMESSEDRPRSLVIMSATLNADAEKEYWRDYNPVVFTIPDNQRYTCVRTWEPATAPAQAALNLVNEGHRGVLVFVSGIKDIEQTVLTINEDILRTPPDVPVEIATIHGSTDYEQRMVAFKAPEIGAKILIGTNVLESGMNIPWVDAGVSSGLQKRKVVARESGAIVLQEVPMSLSNVEQQAGRTNRFRNSKFILCGQANPKMMEAMPVSELVCLPLTELIMHCLAYEVDPRELSFLPELNHDKLDEAYKTLYQLGFIDKDNKLTVDGEFTKTVPVGLETAALLCHASKLEILPEALVLAAIFENGSILQDRFAPFCLDRLSTIIDNAMAFVKAYMIPKSLSYSERKLELESMNINLKRFSLAVEILQSLENALQTTVELSVYDRKSDLFNEDVLAKLRQCILAASVNRLGYTVSRRRSSVIMHNGGISISPEKSSGVTLGYEKKIVSGNLNVITPRHGGSPFTVIGNITVFEYSDLVNFTKIRSDVFTFERCHYSYATQVSVFSKPFTVLDVPLEVSPVEAMPEELPPQEKYPKGSFEAKIDYELRTFHKPTQLVVKPAPVVLPLPKTKLSSTKVDREAL